MAPANRRRRPAHFSEAESSDSDSAPARASSSSVSSRKRARRESPNANPPPQAGDPASSSFSSILPSSSSDVTNYSVFDGFDSSHSATPAVNQVPLVDYDTPFTFIENNINIARGGVYAGPRPAQAQSAPSLDLVQTINTLSDDYLRWDSVNGGMMLSGLLAPAWVLTLVTESEMRTAIEAKTSPNIIEYETPMADRGPVGNLVPYEFPFRRPASASPALLPYSGHDRPSSASSLPAPEITPALDAGSRTDQLPHGGRRPTRYVCAPICGVFPSILTLEPPSRSAHHRDYPLLRRSQRAHRPVTAHAGSATLIRPRPNRSQSPPAHRFSSPDLIEFDDLWPSNAIDNQMEGILRGMAAGRYSPEIANGAMEVLNLGDTNTPGSNLNGWIANAAHSSTASAALSVALSRLSDISSARRLAQRHLQGSTTLDDANTGRRIHIGRPGDSRTIFIPTDVAAVFAVLLEPAPTGSDVWPDIRDRSKVPYVYTPVSVHSPQGSDFNDPHFSLVSNRHVSPHVEEPESDFVVDWPMRTVPSELYRGIMDYLSRDDIKAMRLTCKEFENEVSHALFANVVVPFNTEIYGMLRATQNGFIDVKGKGKAKARSSNSANMIWQNANDDDIYEGQGINVFKGFGRHIKKYGMSFEVTEDTLAKPPLKGTRQAHRSYWGIYDWPYQEYKRFDEVAEMENAADETFKMKTAFSYLTDVKELALSIDSGLGYLHGPDVSLHSRIFNSRPAVFGTSRPIPDRKQQAAIQFWNALKAVYSDRTANPSRADLKHASILGLKTPSLSRLEWSYLVNAGHNALSRHARMPYLPQNLLNHHKNASGDSEEPRQSPGNGKKPLKLDGKYNAANVSDCIPFESGLIFFADGSTEVDLENEPVVPANLKKLQREWLLETEWAQLAFISSYMVAIVDNPHTFRNVHTMNFARLSSRFLMSLCRQDFWSSLPNIQNIKLHVIPDWRDVVKDSAGFVETPSVAPSVANLAFGRLLSDIIAPMKQLKSLEVGWAAGGERETGMFARNRNLMPAPVLPHDWTINMLAGDNDLAQRMIWFRYVEHLALTNCWITPGAVQVLIRKHQNDALQKLTFDSVSLTAIPRNGGQQNPNVQAAVAAAANNLPWVPINWPGVPAVAQAAGQQQQPAGAAQAPAGVQNAAPPGAANNWPQFAIQAGGPPINLAAFPAAPAPAPAFVPVQPPAPVPAPALATNTATAANSAPAWLGPHREGSWPWLLDKISPGITLKDHGSRVCPESIITDTSRLRTLEFRSCGYAKLALQRFDQSAIEDPNVARPPAQSPWFFSRGKALGPAMMKSGDALLGEVVPHLGVAEQQALVNGWEMVVGWGSEGEREEPTFDGCLEGGTGRFSGVVERVEGEDEGEEEE